LYAQGDIWSQILIGPNIAETRLEILIVVALRVEKALVYVNILKRCVKMESTVWIFSYRDIRCLHLFLSQLFPVDLAEERMGFQNLKSILSEAESLMLLFS
jgi:hypothetical protein